MLMVRQSESAPQPESALGSAAFAKTAASCRSQPAPASESSAARGSEAVDPEAAVPRNSVRIRLGAPASPAIVGEALAAAPSTVVRATPAALGVHSTAVVAAPAALGVHSITVVAAPAAVGVVFRFRPPR